MTIASEHVTVFRTQWASRFVDTCDIRRLDARGDINDTTLVYDAESEPNIATGQACLFRPGSGAPTVTEFGQQGISKLDAQIHFAHNAVELRVEDTITIVTSVSSPKLAGKIYRVTAVWFDSYQTHMWADVELDQGPGETNQT